MVLKFIVLCKAGNQFSKKICELEFQYLPQLFPIRVNITNLPKFSLRSVIKDSSGEINMYYQLK